MISISLKDDRLKFRYRKAVKKEYSSTVKRLKRKKEDSGRMMKTSWATSVKKE
jgi:hypothetical protein